MVQKDDPVIVNFEEIYPNITEKKLSYRFSFKDPESLSSEIKNSICLSYETIDYVIDRCVLTFLNKTYDVTSSIIESGFDIAKVISESGFFEKNLESVQRLNSAEKVLQISIYYKDKKTQIFEDESDSDCYTSQSYGNKESSRNYVRSAASHDFLKRLDSSDNFENLRTAKSALYNNGDATEYKYVGLVNQAMTCYLNSLLQALYMTPEFRNAVYNWEYKDLHKNHEDRSIPYQLQKLFLNLQTSSKAAVETTSLTTSFGWNYHDAWDQHDIQELCRVMFDALEQTFKDTQQADLISRLYEGKINDYVKCLTCQTEKSREDTFLDIPLPVKPFDGNAAYECVEDALEAFVKYETLEGNNQYFCEECNRMSDAHKGLKFTRFPYILTLQLKRFDFDQKTFHRIKLNDKVIFPFVLNLNSFIEAKSNQYSSNQEDDCIKSDGFTTDSSTVNKEYVINDVKMSSSNHLINSDQDDEGIDMESVMLSSCSKYNYDIQKLRQEYTTKKGPYIYELFSIMIHSGSASGGHYYAYIKDFRNEKWQCFNDQNVVPINNSDISKVYGGSARTPSYGGAYRSSTNAYMLMYRQIDTDRNVLPLEAQNFPPHIKEILERMKSSEKDQSYHDKMFPEHLNIYYRHPESGCIKLIHLVVKLNYTLAKVTESAYSKIIKDTDLILELNQCRIVSYFVAFDLVDQVYDDNIRLDKILIENQSKNFLLDIRQSEKFELYPADPVVTKVFLVDPVKQELIDYPKFVRAHARQSIKEYKQELTKYFDVNPDKLQLICSSIHSKTLKDDFVFETNSHSYPLYICATEIHETESIFYKMSEQKYLQDIITFDLDVSEISTEQYKYLNISPLIENSDEKILKCNSSDYHGPIDELSKLNICTFDKNKCNSMKGIDLQEMSNSEDSSLSDSDRTLVGDVPDVIDFDHESVMTIAKNEIVEIKKCIKISDIPDSKFWKVSVSSNITEDELKEQLQQKLGISKDDFRICEVGKEENKSFRCGTSFRGEKYQIHLGRIPNCDEHKVDIYILKIDNSEPIQKLFTINIKKNILIGKAKEQILAEYKKIYNINLDYERCQFMEIQNEKLLNNMTKDEHILHVSDKIYIQEREETDELELKVYLRRWNRSEMQLENVQTININNYNINDQIIEKISSEVDIPVERLQFYPLPITKLMRLENIELYDWKSNIKLDEMDLFNTYILYRDYKQTPKGLHEREIHKIYNDKKNCFERGRMGMLTPMASSPRKEKALKIHVHST